jgi:hypothetical protein
MDVKPYTYREVRPGLFDAVVEGRLPPGDGPIPSPGGLKTNTGGT